MQGKYDEATEALEASLEIRKSQSNKTSVAYTISDLSEVAFRKGDYESARQYAEESLEMRQEAQTEWGIAKSLHQLAQAKHKLGLQEEALQHSRESLTIFERLQYKKGIAESLSRIAQIRFDMGEKDVAARLFGAAEAILDSLGKQLAADQRDYYDSAMLASAHDNLEKKAWSAGRNMSMEAAIALAQGA
jgi:tetratricopeptide (TPR) repeat protein